MLISHLFVALLCAGALRGGDVRAGQGVEESQPAREDKMTLTVYCVDALLKSMQVDDLQPNQDTAAEAILKQITASIDPPSWADVGGKATIQFFPLGRALVVLQTQANQKEIKDLLASIRRNQTVEVRLDAHIVCMPPAKAKIFLALTDTLDQSSDDPEPSPGVAFLSEQQLQVWFEVFQGDRDCNVVQAPSIKVQNGQKGEIKIGEAVSISTSARDAEGQKRGDGQERAFLGIHGKFLPHLSADGRFVRLQVDWRMANLDERTDSSSKLQQMGLETTVMVPSNNTAVFSLGNLTTQRTETGAPPVLSKIPYLSRLFTNSDCSTEAQAVFLLVTPHFNANEENNPAACGHRCVPR